jgi:hypothetical protein
MPGNAIFPLAIREIGNKTFSYMSKSQRKKQIGTQSGRTDTASFILPSVWTGRKELYIALGAALFALAAGLLYIIPMRGMAGAPGFPLDDSWIPLTLARNLREFGAYSFFERDMVTSGSTSPLYVFLLALLGLFTSSEFIPTFLIGIGSFMAAAFFLVRLGRQVFAGEQWLAAVAVALFILLPKLQSASASGMATMLYVALVTAAACRWFARKPAHAYFLAGLALWVRPDALVFLAALALDALYKGRFAGDPKAASTAGDARGWNRSSVTGAVVCTVLVVAYVGFNLLLGGGVFPNPVAAKIAYYGGAERAVYLKGVFGYYAYSVAAVFLPFVLGGLIVIAIDIVKRRPVRMLLPAAYLVGTVLAYGIFLPVLRDDGRYLAPTLPFFLLIGIWSLKRFTAMLAELVPAAGMRVALRYFAFGVFLLAGIVGLSMFGKIRTEHYRAVRYVRDRQVAAARWVSDSTARSAVVATHSIGAMGYYGRRRMIDMIGIATPEMIPSIGNLQDLEVFLKGRKTDYIATLREQFEVVNVNPLFTSDPNTPEVMEVFRFISGRTHVMAQPASALNVQAARLMQARMDREAALALKESYRLDPMSSRTSTLLGVCLLNLKDTAQAITFLDQAILLHPDYAPAMLPLGDVFINKKDYRAAVSLLQRAVELNPKSQNARASLKRALDMREIDSLRAAGWNVGSYGL